MDWHERLEAIDHKMLRQALQTAASEHIETKGWRPLLAGGIYDVVYRTVKELGGDEAVRALRAASAGAQRDAVDNLKRKTITGF